MGDEVFPAHGETAQTYLHTSSSASLARLPDNISIAFETIMPRVGRCKEITDNGDPAQRRGFLALAQLGNFLPVSQVTEYTKLRSYNGSEIETRCT